MIIFGGGTARRNYLYSRPIIFIYWLSMSLKVDCPTCDKRVSWKAENEFRPFCSERCKLIDLGDWAEENHKISQPMQKDIELSEEMLDALEDEFIQHNKFFVEPE